MPGTPLLLRVTWDSASRTWLIRNRQTDRYLETAPDQTCGFTPDKSKARRFASEAEASVAMRDVLNAIDG